MVAVLLMSTYSSTMKVGSDAAVVDGVARAYNFGYRPQQLLLYPLGKHHPSRCELAITIEILVLNLTEHTALYYLRN
jgi:hypothetical protein